MVIDKMSKKINYTVKEQMKDIKSAEVYFKIGQDERARLIIDFANARYCMVKEARRVAKCQETQ
jgi:hypothetical protein